MKMNQSQASPLTREPAKQNSNRNGGEGAATLPQFFCEPGFYDKAGILRTQFESQVLGARETSGGMTPFSYAFCENSYQFLTASAERIFTADALGDLIEKIRSWSAAALGLSRVSTPQIRVFVAGCRRNLLRDDIASPWRYSLSITRQARREKTTSMTLATEDPAVRAGEHMRVDTILSANMEFNQLFAHKTKDAYSIESGVKSMNPVEGIVLLDGYLW